MKKLLLIVLLIVGCDEDNALEQVLAEVEDCAGVEGGDAIMDVCGNCNGGINNVLGCKEMLIGNWYGPGLSTDHWGGVRNCRI